MQTPAIHQEYSIHTEHLNCRSKGPGRLGVGSPISKCVEQEPHMIGGEKNKAGTSLRLVLFWGGGGRWWRELFHYKEFSHIYAECRHLGNDWTAANQFAFHNGKTFLWLLFHLITSRGMQDRC